MSTPTERATNWLSAFSSALARNDAAGAAALFETDSHWRDLVAFSWNIKTVEGRAAIEEMLKATLGATKPSNWKIDGDASEKDGVTEAWLDFETAVARGRGHVRLRGDPNGVGRAWTLLTTAQELKGFEEKKGRRRWNGAEHGVHPGRKTWLELKQEDEATLGYSKQPYVVIVGGGQGGLALGARLKRLGVPTIIVEKHERAGDSWRKRYKSLCLHDPVWYDHMPYLPFPDDWPVFSPKDKIGDWLEAYAKIMELNLWTRTECKRAQYDAAKKEWTVEVVRDGKPVTLRPKQLVLATGQAGLPNMPDYPGMTDFKGQQRHSSQHPGGEDWSGKKCVVIGSNNSAHDICADLWEHGADVTMVQRSSTHVSRSETLMELWTYPLWGEQALENGISCDEADMIAASMPYRLMAEPHQALTREMKRRDADFYARLEKAGFMLDFGDDESGLPLKYYRRGSGYYIDVGASELICNGSIKLKRGKVERITATGVKFTDGSELPADLIVYATGYGSMNGWAAQLISQEVADKVGKVWGLGSGTTKDPGPWEGEFRNMWKPTQQEGLWFHGGNLHQSRHYSQFLSLQLKARMEGLPTPVYGLPKTHHLS
jgi:putative flavoprotein involved in K+ transport